MLSCTLALAVTEKEEGVMGSVVVGLDLVVMGLKVVAQGLRSGEEAKGTVYRRHCAPWELLPTYRQSLG